MNFFKKKEKKLFSLIATFFLAGGSLDREGGFFVLQGHGHLQIAESTAVGIMA